jgi:hypothetical protein
MLTREQLTVKLYGGEDYRVYDGARLIATVYAESDLRWLLDRAADLAPMLARVVPMLEDYIFTVEALIIRVPDHHATHAALVRRDEAQRLLAELKEMQP